MWIIHRITSCHWLTNPVFGHVKGVVLIYNLLFDGKTFRMKPYRYSVHGTSIYTHAHTRAYIDVYVIYIEEYKYKRLCACV